MPEPDEQVTNVEEPVVLPQHTTFSDFNRTLEEDPDLSNRVGDRYGYCWAIALTTAVMLRRFPDMQEMRPEGVDKERVATMKAVLNLSMQDIDAYPEIASLAPEGIITPTGGLLYLSLLNTLDHVNPLLAKLFSVRINTIDFPDDEMTPLQRFQFAATRLPLRTPLLVPSLIAEQVRDSKGKQLRDTRFSQHLTCAIRPNKQPFLLFFEPNSDHPLPKSFSKLFTGIPDEGFPLLYRSEEPHEDVGNRHYLYYLCDTDPIVTVETASTFE